MKVGVRAAISVAAFLAVTGAGWELRGALYQAAADHELFPPRPALNNTSVRSPELVEALGRIEPRDGVMRIAAPSPAAVIAKLFVDEGDPIQAGQIIALLDDYEKSKADVARLQAQLDNAIAERARGEALHQAKILNDSAMDAKRLAVEVTRAELQGARAQLELTQIRSPITGHVLKVHAHEGEQVGPEGIVEVGRTGEMCTIAEVYETDIGRVRLNQKATITSPALPKALSGVIDRIGLKIGKQDVLSTDPAARIDARVVEVRVRLDDSAVARNFTHLQVDVTIAP